MWLSWCVGARRRPASTTMRSWMVSSQRLPVALVFIQRWESRSSWRGASWGAIVVSTAGPDPLPQDTAVRLGSFTELLATAIANAESREALGRLADEQTALRRVATLVARGTPPSEVFAAVANEMARCLHAANVTVSSFDDDAVTIVAVAALTPGIKHAPLVGIRRTLSEGDNIATRVFHTGQPARLEGLEFQNAPGSVAAWLRKTGLCSSVAVPIIVDGRVWGMAALGSLRPEPMPPDTEARMSDFADRSHAGFIPPSCPREDSLPRSRHWPADRPFPSPSTSRLTNACRTQSKSARITSCPKH
jgi:GAF domain